MSANWGKVVAFIAVMIAFVFPWFIGMLSIIQRLLD